MQTYLQKNFSVQKLLQHYILLQKIKNKILFTNLSNACVNVLQKTSPIRL